MFHSNNNLVVVTFNEVEILLCWKGERIDRKYEERVGPFQRDKVKKQKHKEIKIDFESDTNLEWLR
jgi:hypothetical protein